MMTTNDDHHAQKIQKEYKTHQNTKNGDQLWKKCQTAISFFLTTP